MQRLLDRLEYGISHGRIPREIPFLRAERAVMLVRMGEIERARRDITALRALPDAQTNTALNAWLWLAEGLADFFENLGRGARDRVLRAYALASSAKAPRIQALSAAWAAHLDFRAQDHAATIEHLRAALKLAQPEHYSARARAAVVLAGAYHFADREDLAQPWYVRARAEAASEGDGVTLSSINYNMAALRVMQARLAEMFGELDEKTTRRALIGAESSSSLDRNVQTRALGAHSMMHRAQILAASGRYADALSLYDSQLPQALAEGLAISECLFHADRASCLLRLGRGDEALQAARTGATALSWATEVEERAITHALLARVFGPLGLGDLASNHARDSQVELVRHQQRCDALLQMLQAGGFEAWMPGPKAPHPARA
jgi:tetratricopeptide (TPR) repeat protein